MAEALRTKTDVGELLKDGALFREAAFINGERHQRAAFHLIKPGAFGIFLVPV